MADTPTQPTLHLLPLPIVNQMWPKSGIRAIPVQLDFTVADSILVDMSNQQQLGKFDLAQGVYVDNSQNSDQLKLQTTIVGQIVIIPPNSQGFIPLLFGQNPQLTCTTQGDLILNLWVLNVPMPCTIWSTISIEGGGVATEVTIADQPIQVQDIALENLISDGGLNVNVISGGGGGSTEFAQSNLNPGTGGTAFLLTNSGYTQMVPEQADYSYITGFDIYLTPDAYCVGGAQNAQLSVGSNTQIWNGNVYVPGEAPSNPSGGLILIHSTDGCLIPSSDLNQPVGADWEGAALTAGYFVINFRGYWSSTAPTYAPV